MGGLTKNLPKKVKAKSPRTHLQGAPHFVRQIRLPGHFGISHGGWPFIL
jgi:hypothetical protein